MPHVTRRPINPRYPLQVTIRARPGLPSLRSPRLFGAIQRAVARASVDRFRVIHFSIQQDHGHFIVEGDDPRRARGGMHGLAIRLALAVNRVLGRKGKVVGDRYHVLALATTAGRSPARPGWGVPGRFHLHARFGPLCPQRVPDRRGVLLRLRLGAVL
jgi:hypothetical protein